LGRSSVLFAAGEAAWLAGRPRLALEAIDKCESVGLADFAATAMTPVTRSWALVDLGRPAGPPVTAVLYSTMAGLIPESLALVALGDNARLSEAESRFDDAAQTWNGLVKRSELRCRWAAGEAARRAGSTGRARRRLLDVEEETIALGMGSLLNRVRRSLRQVGVRRTAESVPEPEHLSARQREILALVGSGGSTDEISRRLGLSQSTVDALIGSAMGKLGARTRVHAAVLAAAFDDVDS
jgi:DNA-binding CsgD family transcriptional regulator